MTVLREIAAQFGVEVDGKALDALDGQITGLLGQLGQLGGVLAAGLGIQRLNAFVQEMTNAGDELGDVSERLNISTDSLQAWDHAARLSGVEDLNGSLTILQRNLASAAQGGGPAAQAFRRLGVHVKNADGSIRSMDELLPEIADGVASITDPTQRAGIAVGLFGRSGAAMVPLLARGAAGVAELRAQFVELGGGASQEFVENASALADSQERLGVVWFGLRAQVANALIPVFLRAVEAMIQWGGALASMAAQSHVVEAALLVLGASALRAGLQATVGLAGPLATMALFAVSIGFIILLVDDLITLFSGGRSVIGGFIDEMFGAGTAAEVIAELREAWEGLALAITDSYHAVRQFFGVEAPTEPTVRTPEQMREEQRNMAAREGQIRGDRGGTFEEALAATNQRREAQGLAPLDDQGGLPRGGANAPLRTRADVGPGRQERVPTSANQRTNNVDASTQLTINLPPGSDRAQVENMRRVAGELLDERQRSAAAALVREGVE